jgi:ABC-type Fe3+/spermidine/putrescine transport system ATPase subunit
MTPTPAAVRLSGVHFAYDQSPILHDFNLEVPAGELMALLGPSGCGKTTALKVLAGLLHPRQGDIYFGDQCVTGIPAERRQAPMVFQKALLFPHLSVARNVAFSLNLQGLPAGETQRRVEEALALVRMQGYGARLPKELSGGQEQRVAVARAIVSSPRVLLLDEPFSALDESLRGDLRLLLRELQQRLRITTVFVTHDQLEAATMANRIALVLDGRIAQVGPARDFYSKPASLPVARFFGWQALRTEDRRWLAFRGNHAVLESPGASSTRSGWLAFPARLRYCLDLGAHCRCRLQLDGGEEVDVDGPSAPCADGSPVRLMLDPARVVAFAGDAATAPGW